MGDIERIVQVSSLERKLKFRRLSVEIRHEGGGRRVQIVHLQRRDAPGIKIILEKLGRRRTGKATNKEHVRVAEIAGKRGLRIRHSGSTRVDRDRVRVGIEVQSTGRRGADDDLTCKVVRFWFGRDLTSATGQKRRKHNRYSGDATAHQILTG